MLTDSAPSIPECDICGYEVSLNEHGRFVHTETTLRSCGPGHGKGAYARYKGLARATPEELADHLAYGTAFGVEDPKLAAELKYPVTPPEPDADQSFEIVGARLPPLAKPIPVSRQIAIAWCKQNPGTWVRYLLGHGDEPVTNPGPMLSHIRNGTGGFEPDAFEGATRNHQVYFRAKDTS